MSKNRSLAITALILSAVVFTVTAFADALLGSGYDNFKQAGKKTILSLENRTEKSYTSEVTFEFKIDGKTINKEYNKERVDSENNKSDSESVSLEKGIREYSNYNYIDSEQQISKSGDSNTYYVYDRGRQVINSASLTEDTLNDIEKIADAIVGNLKNNLQISESDDNGKLYYGTITETEVPVLINAVSSFAIKQSFLSNYRINQNGENIDGFPIVKNNISISGAEGKAKQNKNGLITDVEVHLSFVGDDESGMSHNAEIDITFSLYDIGNTVVEKPNLDGKIVEKTSMYGSQKIGGTYKNDILEETSDGYEKLGERLLVISIDGEVLTGRLYEQYKDGREGYDYSFTLTDEYFHRPFTATDVNGKTATFNLGNNGRGKLFIAPDDTAIAFGGDGSAYYDAEYILIMD